MIKNMKIRSFLGRAFMELCQKYEYGNCLFSLDMIFSRIELLLLSFLGTSQYFIGLH